MLWGAAFLIIGLVVRAQQRDLERAAPLIPEG
jgi:hypothetical protein